MFQKHDSLSAGCTERVWGDPSVWWPGQQSLWHQPHWAAGRSTGPFVLSVVQLHQSQYGQVSTWSGWGTLSLWLWSRHGVRDCVWASALQHPGTEENWSMCRWTLCLYSRMAKHQCGLHHDQSFVDSNFGIWLSKDYKIVLFNWLKYIFAIW